MEKGTGQKFLMHTTLSDALQLILKIGGAPCKRTSKFIMGRKLPCFYIRVDRLDKRSFLGKHIPLEDGIWSNYDEGHADSIVSPF